MLKTMYNFIPNGFSSLYCHFIFKSYNFCHTQTRCTEVTRVNYVIIVEHVIVSNLNKALYVDLQQEPCHLEVGAEEEVWEGAVDAGEGEGLPHKEIKGHLKLL